MPATRPASREARDPLRDHLLQSVDTIEPWDDQEGAHQQAAREWIASGAPLYRTRKPDVPPMHLVSYFAVCDDQRELQLLVAHRKAGLWLPAGGHVEPGEDPWATVVRECQEEIHIDAVASPLIGERPFFLTVTPTRGPGSHTDVSLWFVLSAGAGTITSYDEGEFDAIRWLTHDQVLAQPIEQLDPHMHRFTRKLQHACSST
jgi:8-oxo-dGTP pyrophosphatase MutT (NUDIX family)